VDLDLDLALVRSFVYAAEELHFGAAADRLHITQQALSKRIQRLEEVLAVDLFVRSTRSVVLTPAGQRFLRHAKELLDASAGAVLAIRESAPPLRVDVLHELLAPMALVRRVLATRTGLRVEVSARRGMVPALGALSRGEIDLAFGRIHDLDLVPPTTVVHRVVRLEPLQVLVGDGHPLADRHSLRPADLREVGLWVPNPGRAVEWDGYLRRFAAAFDIPLSFEQPASSQDGLVDLLRAERVRVCVIGCDMPLPGGGQVRAVPLVDPTPVYPWSLAWPTRASPLIREFVSAAVALGGARRTEEIWLPDVDGEA
jgi:DNA-binding transcriptional LysR family regulator